MLDKLLERVPNLVFDREEEGETIFSYVEQEDFMYMNSLQGGRDLDYDYLNKIDDFYFLAPKFKVYVTHGLFLDQGYPLYIRLAVKNKNLSEYDMLSICVMLGQAVEHVKEYNPNWR